MQIAVIHSAFGNIPNTVAFVEVGDRVGNEALEYAYRRTNNINGSWSMPAQVEFEGEMHDNPDYSDDVTVMADLPVRDGVKCGLRSTSVGDQMLFNGKKYEVAPWGFEEIA